MRLRRPCEHGLYDDHSVYVTGFPAVDCPGGEFLPEDAATIARLFHENYERLAPSFGYATRPDSAVPWPPPNAALMIATVEAVLDALAADQVGEPG